MAAWRFLLDENVDPKVEQYLRKESIHAEHVRDALGQGAADEVDVIPYAETADLVIVTSDVTDFSSVERVDIVLLYDDTLPAYEIVSALLALVDAYPNREAFSGREVLDDWT